MTEYRWFHHFCAEHGLVLALNFSSRLYHNVALIVSLLLVILSLCVNVFFNKEIFVISSWYQVINDLLDPTGQNLRVREDAQVSYILTISYLN